MPYVNILQNGIGLFYIGTYRLYYIILNHFSTLGLFFIAVLSVGLGHSFYTHKRPAYGSFIPPITVHFVFFADSALVLLVIKPQLIFDVYSPIKSLKTSLIMIISQFLCILKYIWYSFFPFFFLIL